MRSAAADMRLALAAAVRAGEAGEIPVGALVINAEGVVVASAGNERERTGDPTAHAEIVALRAAAKAAGEWRLTGHTLVVTLEPCAMCAGAIVQARIEKLIFGAYDPKAGAVSSLFDLLRDPRLNHRVDVQGGVLAEEAGALLSDFFVDR